MEVSLKRILSLIFSVLTVSLGAFALDMPFFSGYAGVLMDYQNEAEDDGFNPYWTAESFFTGQLDFNGNFLIRGEFCIQATDLFEHNIFEETSEKNAFFRMEEFSLTYKLNTLHATHYFSLFLGNYEPTGSDVFIQRQFGILPVSSQITKSWHGLSGASIYPFYGGGFNYTYHPERNLVFSARAYENKQETSDSEDYINVLNTDLRLAMLYRYFLMDFSLGLGFPLGETDDTGEDVVLIVRELQLHSGLTMILGNRQRSSFFMQLGFENFNITAKDDEPYINFKDIYFLLEPRFRFRACDFNFSLFNIPAGSADDMIFLKGMVYENNADCENLLGANFTLESDHLYIGNTNFTFGFHTTFAWTNPDIENFKEDKSTIKDWNKELYLTTFTEMPIFGGKLSAAITANCLGMDNWKGAFLGTLGFKTQF